MLRETESCSFLCIEDKYNCDYSLQLAHSLDDFISLPKSCPSLLCCRSYFIYIYLYIDTHNYPNTLGYTVQHLPSLQRAVSQFSCSICCLMRPLFLVSDLVIVSFVDWMHSIQMLPVPKLHDSIKLCFCAPDTTNTYVTLYLFCISHLLYFSSFCLLTFCSSYHQFQSVWLPGLFQKYFNTYSFGEQYVSNFQFCLEVWLCSQYADSFPLLFTFITSLLKW